MIFTNIGSASYPLPFLLGFFSFLYSPFIYVLVGWRRYKMNEMKKQAVFTLYEIPVIHAVNGSVLHKILPYHRKRKL